MALTEAELLELQSYIDPSKFSKAQSVSLMSEDEQREFFSHFSVDQLKALDESFDWWGRPGQITNDNCTDPKCGCGGRWLTWIWLCGRGYGKTESISQWVHQTAWKYPGIRIGVISPTAGDMRRVMIEGPSGVLAKAKSYNPVEYFPTNLECKFKNGSHCALFSADEPRRLRGPNFGAVAMDELAAWPKAEEVYAMAKYAQRLRAKQGWPSDYLNRCVIATTPQAVEPLMTLVGHKGRTKPRGTHVCIGNTFENLANLDDDFIRLMMEYRRTRLGRQEINAEILDDSPGALWKTDMIDPNRITKLQLPVLRRTVVAIDPAMGGENATGIVVCAKGVPGESQVVSEEHEKTRVGLQRNQKIHGYVLADKSTKGSPDTWARAAVRAYYDYDADCIVAESNQGGDLVRHTIHTVDSAIPVDLVHATKNKKTRAEPIVALYEQGRVHHVGKFPELEDEQLGWDPEENHKSPDRLDACVWGLTSLIGDIKRHHGAVPQSVGMRAPVFALPDVYEPMIIGDYRGTGDYE